MSNLELTLEPVEVARHSLFKNLFYSVWTILAIYIPIYYVFETWIPFYVGLFCLFVLAPINLWLKKRRWDISARLFFIANCNFIIFTTGLGLGHRAVTEYYFIPTLIISYLVFPANRRDLIFCSIGITVATWIGAVFGGTFSIPNGLIPEGIRMDVLTNINFLGAVLTTLLFLNLFLKSNILLRNLLVAEVQSESDRYRTITETISEGLFIQDQGGQIIYQNAEAEQILGISPQEWIGGSDKQRSWRLFREDGRDFAMDDHPSRIALRTGQPVRGVVMGLDLASNDRRWIRINASPIEQDKFSRVVVTFADISQIMSAQNEKRLMIDSLEIGVWKLNAVTKVAEWDESMYRLYEVESAKNDPTFDLWQSCLTDRTREQVNQDLAAALLGSKEFNLSYEIQVPSGRRKIIGARGVVVRDSGGQPIAMYGINWDRTGEAEAERDIQHIFNLSPDLICMVSLAGHFLRVNPSFHKILGFHESEFLSKPFMEFVHPDDVDATRRQIESVTLNRSKFTFETRCRTHEGKYRLVSWIAYPDLESGVVYATGRDVTDSKSTELRNREILTAIDEMAIVDYADVSGRITYVNENFCRVSGFHQSEIVGKDHRLVSSGLHPKSDFREMWRLLLRGQSWTGDITNRRKDGQLYHVRTLITPLKDLSGRIYQFMAIRFDVTHQKRSERLLVEAQSLAKVGSWTYNLLTHELTWTSEHYRIFEIEEPQLQGQLYQMYRERIHADDLAELDGILEKTIKTGEGFIYNHRVVLDGGKRFKYVQGIGEVVKNKVGEPIYLSGTCRDRTAEEMMERSLEAERAKTIHNAKLASLGEMSAGIAHEINNPLAIVTGSLLLMERHRLEDEKFNSKLEAAKRACVRIEKIVNGLRKFARANVGGEYRDLSLDLLISEATVLTEAKAKRFGVKVETELAANQTIHCDEVEIEQVFVNLINNAIDAVKDLPEKWVKVRTRSEGDVILVQVIDSGAGIAPEVESKLYEPFYTTKAVGEGTGLGLSISKGILDEHSATLAIDHSQKNTCFEIRFMRAQVKSA